MRPRGVPPAGRGGIGLGLVEEQTHQHRNIADAIEEEAPALSDCRHRHPGKHRQMILAPLNIDEFKAMAFIRSARPTASTRNA